MKWLPHFAKELEKVAFVGAMFNVMNALGSVKEVKSAVQKTKLESLKSNEPNMQLPSPVSNQFDSKKRVDAYANSAVQRY